jgi:BirA family biotin operon repressor/biotin-[acetyl-CoA-carboxylase] ligase
MLPDGEGWAKAGGILLETVIREGRLEQAILGMGLNVNIPQEQLPVVALPATSILVATGRPVARLPLLRRIVERLGDHYKAAGEGKSPQPTWNERLLTGNRVVVSGGGRETLTGTMLGTDKWGRLLLETEAGTVHRIAAGEVTLRAKV